MRKAVRWSGAGLVLVVGAVVAAAVHILSSVAAPSCVDASYSHVAVVPLLCGGLIGIAVALASVARRCLEPAEREIAIHTLARQTTCTPAIAVWAAVCAAALALFCVAEGVEQIAAFGHVLPISAHYDSLVMLGLFALCSGIACTVLRSLLQLVIATVAVVAEWFFSAPFNFAALHGSTREMLNFIPPSKQAALESATRRGPPFAPALA
jgi:hypothetical protein